MDLTWREPGISQAALWVTKRLAQWSPNRENSMGTLFDVLLIVHVLNAILMAWPFYALVVVNHRARLGPPVGDRADTYMENIIKSRSVPCFVFQGTALATGLALVQLQGLGLGTVATDTALAAKTVLLLVIGGLLGYVHFGLQRQIDRLFLEIGEGVASVELAEKIGVLRMRRKLLASVCLFSVLTMAILGIYFSSGTAGTVTVVMIPVIGLFVWRAYKSAAPFGWM
jgi:hypothetical protein